MRTTLTQRIAAAEALIAEQRQRAANLARQNAEKLVTINKLVAERDDAKSFLLHQNETQQEMLEIVSKLTDDLQDAKEDNDRLQGRLALQTDTLEFYRDSLMIVEDRLEEIRNLKHPWWMVFFPHSGCPICKANVL